jgi:phage shock protein PspC (stress-responsive transcriptional regulator)
MKEGGIVLGGCAKIANDYNWDVVIIRTLVVIAIMSNINYIFLYLLISTLLNFNS